MNTKLTKIINEGQPCRHCGTSVIKRAPKEKPRGDRAFYFEYVLWCPKCRRVYLVESAKRFWSEN